MSLWLLIVLLGIWLGAVYFFRKFRIWIFYYLVGTVGLAYFLVEFISLPLSLEPLLAQSVALSVHDLLAAFNIPTQVFENAPGVLLVLVVTQNIGWTVLNIGVESSGLLEISVLLSLVTFYPAWTTRKKIWLCLFGSGLTWFANVLRMVFIALMLHYLGKESLVLAHTFLGKAFFFGMTILIYWLMMTSTSLDSIRSQISAGIGKKPV